MSPDQLIFSPLFSGSRAAEVNLPFNESVRLSLDRAKAIVRAYAFRVEDVLEIPSAALWDMHIDPIMTVDGAAATFATIQVNLVAGTLSAYLKLQPHVRQIMEEVLSFQTLAHYCLTEVGHGLDALNLETVATALPGGGFDLHSPSDAAAKMMPPTSPCGTSSIAIVFAQLQVEGKFCGIRPFIVPLTDGSRVMPGIRIKLLPMRGGSPPVNHCLTYFNHVHLSQEALLGSMESLPPTPNAARLNFLAINWRAAAGALALSSLSIPALQKAAYIVGRYSQHRKVGPEKSPIINFRTQHTPILVALAQSIVYKEFWKLSVRKFTESSLDPRIKHAYAAVFKATLIHDVQAANTELSQRLGARGLFQFSDIVSQYNALQGVAIAEGDILGLSIRLISELLLGRYALPPSTNPSSLVSRHEIGLITEFKEILERGGHHRSEYFNRFVLPHCARTVRAIGHRMAYDAAVDNSVDERATALYLAAAMKQDSAWYVLGADMTVSDQETMLDNAIEAALPLLDQWLDETGIEPYAQVPILSPQHWQSFIDDLPEFQDDQIIGEFSRAPQV
ncbi:hypothetical protein GYMLUDRAFT_178284 [Collybiopsis luxurians FD-317 M1]|uniref:Unplaced genomic scaffold GYMLUscaffold_74, whole genome shotgun sequence n=1 Tax=Collybiopsis luxurians FD-317 M1 TaxID=944289 RepID=A0A0D0C7P7_9AGAR|nr:hypothetical protein GYMLUDRAFT_178284 [Collybiopsis luxurians FD-317 M1]